MFFQEREFLMREGHRVIDFSMRHSENLPSEFSRYFVSNVDYSTGTRSGERRSAARKIKIAIDFVHNREAVKKLTSLVNEEKPQIAHLHNIYHQITPAIIDVMKKAGVKVLMTLHDYKVLCPSYLMLNKTGPCNRCKGKFFWHAVLSRCRDNSLPRSLLLTIEAYWHRYLRSYEGVDLFLSPSRFMADLLVHSGFEKSRVKVLHNGVCPEDHPRSRAKEDYVLHFGRLARGKGTETLLRAHSLLPEPITLRIVGTGPLLPELRQKYPSVEFTGHKSGGELKEIIRNASFVVIPSEWYENFSMTALEAMAFAKPVIASRIGGLPEQIEDGRTGLLFRAGDVNELAAKMNLLIENKTLRKELGLAARVKLAREYSLDRHCRILVETYEALLSRV